MKYWIVVSRIEEENSLIGLVSTYMPIFHYGIEYITREINHKTPSIGAAALTLISAVGMYQVPTERVLSES